VRCLLDHPSAAATINHDDRWDRTALWWACHKGHAGVVTALLERGADPTIADEYGRIPMVAAERNKHRACIEALEVRCSLHSSPIPRLLTGLAEAWGLVLGVGGKRRSGPTSCGRPGR
jgi:ankyrin repeat protein